MRLPAPLRGGVTVWGITDGDSWIPGYRRRADWPLLFDAGFQPKPALAGMAAGLSARPMNGVLRIGTPGDYAPYSWYDSVSGTYRGSDVGAGPCTGAAPGFARPVRTHHLGNADCRRPGRTFRYCCRWYLDYA